MPDLRSSIDEALLRVITVNPIQNEASNSCSYLDLPVKQEDGVKENGASISTSLADVVVMEANGLHSSMSHSSVDRQYGAPVCLVSHMPSNINQDLAEADQSMENDVANNENASNSPEIINMPERGHLIVENEISAEGAVGGIDASPLPDLAKVTTNCEIDFVDTDL